MKNNNKFLSIVVATRNDKHSGNMTDKIRLFITGLATQLENQNFESELIIVEWNPINYLPGLQKVIKFPGTKGKFSIRVITVPSSIHNKFANADKIGLFQFIAKNAGIKRALGEFVLSTNVDILFPSGFWDGLPSYLRRDTFYRAVRFDISEKIDTENDFRKIQTHCEKNVLRIFWPWDTEEFPGKKSIAGLVEKLILRVRFKYRLAEHKFSKKLFTNACGDFTLMHKSIWRKIRGYPEFPFYGVKLDGLACYQAYYRGANEKILSLDKCIFHINHPNTWTSKSKEMMEGRLNQKKVPFMSTMEYNVYINRLKETKGNYYFNNKNWGLGNLALPIYESI
jgi:hypothetical protein